MKKKLNIFLPVIQALFLSFIVFLSLNHISCKVSSEGIQVLSGDYESPELQSVCVKSDSEKSSRMCLYFLIIILQLLF